MGVKGTLDVAGSASTAADSNGGCGLRCIWVCVTATALDGSCTAAELW